MALSTTRTLITQTGINTHQVLNVGGLDSAGIATFSNFKTGSSNLHSTGLTVGDTFLHSTGVNLGAGATVSNNGNATFSGIITASSFVGDISNATGAAAGLGTALSQTQTDPHNKIYYTNKVLSISTTTTIDHPATTNIAYTQYGDIKIEDGHDLIIKDGDELRPDVLGLSTTKTLDTNNFPDGLRGNLIGDVTGDVTGNINNSTLLLKTGGSERIRIDSSGRTLLNNLGNATPGLSGNADDLVIGYGTQSGETGITMYSTTNSGIRFNDNSGTDGAIEYSHNDRELRFNAANAIRLKIDSSGNVTKPTSFHILVDRDGNQTGYSATGTTGAVIWNRVRTAESSPNAANHFNTSTGIFTAPVTGLYFFHAAVNCNYNVEGAWLIINGSRPNFGVFNPNSAQTSDGTITYHLTAGDEVGLKWYDNGNTNGTINSNALHTWWRIILLG